MGRFVDDVVESDFDVSLLHMAPQSSELVFAGFAILGAERNGENHRLPFEAVIASVENL